jgi:hypothetical protein
MFTVAAVLPFLPLIEDAMIRQLGDDDFAKREAATRFLERVLQNTKDTPIHPLFLKIEEAHNGKNAEIRLRTRRLYSICRSKSILGHTFLCVTFRTHIKLDTLKSEKMQIAWQTRYIECLHSCGIQDGWRGGAGIQD